MRPQAATIAHLCVRDLPMQIAAGLLLCGSCWYAGYQTVAIIVACMICLSETVLYCVVKQVGPLQNLTKDHSLLIALAICSVNAALYQIPAVYLAGDPSLALKITGMLWIMGVQVYIANAWSRVPVFLFAELSLAMTMMVLAFFRLSDTPPVSSSPTDWGIAFVFMLVFIYSSIDTLRQQLATETELFVAQRDAATRLAQLEEAYRLDTLTGLLNRPAFDTALNIMLEDRRSEGGEVAVFLIDLDSFKPINDTYTHEAGDRVLLQTARRLQSYVGDNGIVGRLGGDEFICAMALPPDGPAATDIARDFNATVTTPIDWKGRTLSTSASIGIAITGTGPDAPVATVPALCSAADQAMFAAKYSPTGNAVTYEARLFAPRMTPQDKQTLIDSINNRDLQPHYQPKIHLPSGQIIGFEALARWEHPGLGVQQPGILVDQITELGLQGDFMMSMAHQVVEDVNTMLDQGLDPGQVSLNLSEVALATHSGRDELVSLVTANPDAAQHLTFEITENVFIARAADTIQASIAAFRQLGVRISLDDFGTGFASFHHLRQLEFDELKIDTSFVASLGFDPTSEVLVRGFLDIASGLGVSVVAEGVETDAQSRDLINMGCMTAQGYLFSAAVPLAQAAHLLRDQQAA